MTPEATRFLEKAQKLLKEADTMLGVGLNEAAGRTAYLAGFHCAQAFLFERCGKVFKTHHGVDTEFLRLTKDDPRFNTGLRAFLSRSYNLKAIADYETGPGAEIPPEQAAAAVQSAKTFVAQVGALVVATAPGPGAPPIPQPD